MKIDGKIVAGELRSLRFKNRITAIDVCKTVGINTSTLYKYGKDASKLSLETLESLLNYYGTNTYIFFKMIGEYSHNNKE